MCGLTGGWSSQRFSELHSALPGMTDALVHRGRDDKYHWVDAEAGIALGYRRLAVLNQSSAGYQPMTSASGRWIMCFDGQIYNHLDMRVSLEGARMAPHWRSLSDTETFLAAVDAWGVSGALERSQGMFAFALWDRKRRALWLARDRLGEKPLYFGWSRGMFLFGSELKALRAAPGFEAAIDRQALALYLRYSAVPAPFSIYRGIFKLLPGHVLHLSTSALERGHTPASSSYWSASDCAAAGLERPFVGAESEGADLLEVLLRDAVGRQMVADVPVGAFLSGGIDSSVVAAMMQAQSSTPVRTFSIGFEEEQYNEAGHAAGVARHLGTDHTELYVTPEDARAVIPRLPLIYDEPFSDASQVPTTLIAQLARRHVKVALTGDGGDELFGGYNRHFMAARLWHRLEKAPVALRKATARGIAAVPVGAWNALYGLASPLIPARGRLSMPGNKMHKGAAVLGSSSGKDLYRGLISKWKPGELMPNIDEPLHFGPDRDLRGASLAEYMMLEDACHFMPDDCLVKVDRAAMSCSLESRVPLLDHRVFEFAWRLPLNYKIKDGTGKHLLRKVLYRHVPEALIDRPKMGFGIPIDSWLRGPLKEWAGTLLSPDRIKGEGFLDPEPIARKWSEHQAGTHNWQHHLWSILMFQSWLEVSRIRGA